MLSKNIPIILASASPRRSELMKQAGFTFTIIPSSVEESIISETPDKIVEDLAFQKANDVYQSIKKDYAGKDFLVIGADTIVCYNGEILGKPENEQEAFDMLKLLSDRTHQVYTGIAILYKREGEKQTYILNEKTDVTFQAVNDYELKEYIATKDCLDKAGAYGIQGPFAKHIKCINGDYYNVVGLPISRLYMELKKLNAL